MSFSFTHSAWKPGSINAAGQVYIATPTFTTDMVISWEFFRGKNAIGFDSLSSAGSYISSFDSLNDSPNDGAIMGSSIGDTGTIEGTAPNGYITGPNTFIISAASPGGSYPSGTTTLSQFDNENFLDFTGSGTSITAGDVKTFTQIVEVTSHPSAGDIGFIGGTRTGTNGWRLYIDSNGSLNYQYWQYRSPFGTMRSDLLNIQTLTVGEKYMITVVATASGTNKVYVSTGSSNNTTPQTVSVSRMGWASFAPNSIKWANIFSNASTQFNGKFFGIWGWDRELTDTQVGTLYTDLSTAGAI